jgi:hypothetical protein
VKETSRAAIFLKYHQDTPQISPVMNAPSAPFVGTVAMCNYLEPDDTTIIDSEFNNAAFKPLLLLPPSTEREKNNPPSRSRSPFGRRAFHEDQPYPLPHPLLLPSESKDSLIRPYYLSSSPKSPVLLLDIKTPSKPHTSRKRSDSAALWLGVYFMLNLTLTLYNKSVLIHFPFPYTLTALHAFCGSIGTTVLLHWNKLSHLGAPLAAFRTGGRPRPSSLPAPLNRREKCVLFLFSILYTVNIVVSNASLKLVTVPVRPLPPSLSQSYLPPDSSTKSCVPPHRYSPSSSPPSS